MVGRLIAGLIVWPWFPAVVDVARTERAAAAFREADMESPRPDAPGFTDGLFACSLSCPFPFAASSAFLIRLMYVSSPESSIIGISSHAFAIIASFSASDLDFAASKSFCHCETPFSSTRL